MSEQFSTTSFEIAKLSLRPGDVLVVKSELPISAEAVLRIREHFMSLVPGTKVVVIDAKMSLAVLTKEEIKARAA